MLLTYFLLLNIKSRHMLLPSSAGLPITAAAADKAGNSYSIQFPQFPQQPAEQWPKRAAASRQEVRHPRPRL